MVGGPSPGRAPEPGPESVGEVLRHGALEVVGRFVGSSNATLLVTCTASGTTVRAVYKPERGERPLWDFPPGLHRREVAAYELSEALSWSVVPTTVGREDAPFGPGSLQHYLEEDGESHYFTLREAPEHRAALEAIAALDVVANNADRKSGHVIVADGRVWAIDHGLCFHREPKLRTVMWDFAADPVPDRLLADLERVVAAPPRALGALLDPAELEALRCRGRALVAAGRFPEPDERGGWPPYPWPLV